MAAWTEKARANRGQLTKRKKSYVKTFRAPLMPEWLIVLIDVRFPTLVQIAFPSVGKLWLIFSNMSKSI